MTGRTIRYKVGNEHNPTNPFGRSELVIRPDGTVRLDQFSRPPRASQPGPVSTWTGRLDPAAIEALWAELARASFPAVPPARPLPPDSTVRSLTVVAADGTSATASVSWHETASLPGYAQAFDIIDGVIRQLSRDAVKYRSSQPQIVHGIRRRRARKITGRPL